MQMTGADLVITMAAQAAERDQPFAGQFAMMAQQAAIGQSGLLTEAVASRPLEEHEASPVAIILGAFAAAQEMGDAESKQEVLQFGMALLAKWPEYLVVLEQHPSLD